jgi:hypothetical protein
MRRSQATIHNAKSRNELMGLFGMILEIIFGRFYVKKYPSFEGLFFICVREQSRLAGGVLLVSHQSSQGDPHIHRALPL